MILAVFSVDSLLGWLSGLPLLTKVLLGAATTAFLIEMTLRTLARQSGVYRTWTKGLQAVGSIWTAIILSIVYFGPICVTSMVMKILHHDLLDRRLRTDASAWHEHQPNPMGAEAAARQQF